MTRNSVRGFAAGLLVACIVFGGYYYLNDQPEQAEKKPLTIEEIKTASEQLGYTVIKKNEKKQNESKQEAEAKPVTYKLVIKEGMSSEDIGRLLQAQGIIKDAAPLADYLNKHQLTTKIQIGEFTLTSDMTIEKIVALITKLPLKTT